jgi:hypothetical protein
VNAKLRKANFPKNRKIGFFTFYNCWMHCDNTAKSGVISVVKSTSFIHVFIYAFSYAGTSKENGLNIDIELFNMVEEEDYSDEMKKYIPRVNPNWEDAKEVTYKY